MIEFSGRAVRAGTRSIAVVAAASCFAVMPQVADHQPAHADSIVGSAAARGGHGAPHRDHDHEGRKNGHANVVVDTQGPQGAILPGRTYRWPYEVTNRGSAPARNVALTATPDKHLKVLATPPKCRWRRSGQLICKIGLLPQGETKRGVITATVVPKAPTGRSLANPVQVSWHNSPTPETRRTAFPPVEVSPDTALAAKSSIPETVIPGRQVPYEVVMTGHGPVTAEAVVVRSPVTAMTPEGPCGSSMSPAKIPAGKTTPIKPAIGSCEADPATPVAAPCVAVQGKDAAAPDTAAASDKPVAGSCGAAQEKRAVAQDKPAAAPCGAVANKSAGERPAVAAHAPVTPPCAAGQDKSAACSCGAAQEKPATQDKAATQDNKPVTAPSAAVPPQPVVARDKPAAAPSTVAMPAKPAAAPCGAAADKPATPPCAAAPVKPVAAPSTAEDPSTAAAAGKPEAAPCGAVANKSAGEKPAVSADTPVTSPCAAGPDKSAACWCGAAQDKPAAVQPGVALDDKPVAAPSAAAAPGKPAAAPAPVAAEDDPAVAPCAALHDKPIAAPCGAAVPERPAAAVVPGKPEAAPCGVIADKPMVAPDNAASDKPVSPACGAAEEQPIAAPEKSVSMTPLAGPGKAAGKSASRPGRVPARHRHVEALAGRSPVSASRGRQDCVTLGTGFECPGGAIPHHRTHLLKLAAHSRPNTAPHRLRCVDTEIPEANRAGDSAACHTRMARPVAARDNLTIRRLPTTGGSSALLALMGFGLAGAGVVLYRFGRARRSEEG
jgi:hypothetical protein